MRTFRAARWWGAVGGIALAVVDTLTMVRLGVTFQMNGRDVTALVAVSFGSSLALLGFLLGYALEARRRDRRAAALVQAQLEALNAARARLVQSEKLAALGQLATAIAHEVRNPLAVIRSAAQGLGETVSPDDAEAARACAFITAEIDRLGSVVSSLLEFARPLHLEPRAVSVRDLFDRAALLAEGELAARGARLGRDESPGLPAVRADPDLLSQVLLGLLANAAEAVPPGGDVTLAARARDGAVELVVEDSGPGIPPELRDRVFEPFFTTRARGIGLGLAVARQVVEAHGGRIEAGERPGGGARLTVRLPSAGQPAIAA
ncbi:MAG: two-component sensor histidine kinase [Deltaproteobacteria bacterium]|nr:MAG: two-component sensor histidine kinase [Deltaproteobacteria bacterium]